MLTLRPEIHFKDLPQLKAARFAEVWNSLLSEEVKMEFLKNLLEKQPLEKAEKNAACDISRLNKESGWVSFDAEKEDAHSLAETLAAPVAEPLENWRTTTHDDGTEALLTTLAGGTAALAGALGIGQRRAQQIMKQVTREIENRLSGGAGGQGDFFWGKSHE